MTYKIERCTECTYKRREPKPKKNGGVCNKCESVTYYSKKWYFTYSVNGKRYEKAVSSDRTITKEAECIKKAAIIKGEAYSPVSWKSGVKELEETYRGLSSKTIEMYQNCVAKLSTEFGSVSITEITEANLKDYKSKQLAKGMSASSFNRQRSTLKRIFALSGVDWRFKKSVFASEKENVRDRVLTAPERLRLMSACKKIPYLYTAILVALDTGLRKESVLTLEWRDIDWKQNQIVKMGKGEKVHRIPMTKRLRGELRSYRMQQQSISPYCFPSPVIASKPITDIRKSFHAACETAGLTDITMHSLRRTFGTTVVMATGDISVASELLGHSDISVTKRSYVHLLDEHKQSAIKQLEAYV